MDRIPIRPHQIWKSIVSDFQIYISRRKGGKWQTKVLTNKPDKYNGTHTMSEVTIWKKFKLIK